MVAITSTVIHIASASVGTVSSCSASQIRA
jgi:hypothetical protein